ncbi:unnamed protein product [Rangifer tarandus platyrhynchus]|uniref:Uncharacterized protein n=2 Tax=Rangifer tarandus platyrhynchus TaxID=3082113 RepID=A0ABN8ZMH2_RANTA|nr:unnamed protein product [Rangifer tarandus platyrhynchus]CAI9707082.1 unnamed protein product [Rangifer tarandus platyrhynchus]
MLDEGPFLPKRSCSPSRLLEPSGAGRADPSPAWSTAPQRGQRAERLHSRKSSEAGHEGFEDPSSGFWLQTPRHTLGRGSGGLFPLAEPEIQQALVWHSGAPTHTDLPALAPSLHLRKVLERQQPSVSPSPGCPALFQACHF